jgi:formylglycine-generating enzyme required for sulfatase activity
MTVYKKYLGLALVFSGIMIFCFFQESKAENNKPSFRMNDFTDPITGMVFLRVEGGCFQMGNSFEHGHKDEKPIHKVCLNDYYIAKFEVTLHAFTQFIEETNYQTEAEREGHCWGLDKDGRWKNVAGKSWKHLSFSQGGDHPVVCVSWRDAQAFIGWLNHKSSGGFRLLSEAEWEYAARSGGKNRMYATQTGHLNRKLANYGADKCCDPDDTDGYLYTAPVGSYPANDIGVFDLSGNVWEWTADWYDGKYYSHSPQDNPKGPLKGTYRVIRGGSWSIPKGFSRCSNRREFIPSLRHINVGFRLAKDIQ